MSTGKPSTFHSEPVAIIPMSDGSVHALRRSDLAFWQSLCPTLDVAQEFRNIEDWFKTNPRVRQSNEKSLTRLINSWLSCKLVAGIESHPGRALH